MRIQCKKIIQNNSTTIFIFLYGIIIQIVALPAIYYYSLAYKELVAAVEILIFIWFCIPIVSVFSISIAILQIKEKKMNNEKYKTPCIGLALNSLWLLCYLIGMYMVFVARISFLPSK